MPDSPPSQSPAAPTGGAATWIRLAAIRNYHRARGWAIARRHRIPKPVRRVVRAVEHGLDPAVVWLYRHRTGERRPIPPRALRERNAVDHLGFWFEAVDASAEPLERLLGEIDRPVESFSRALDFGCAAGKVVGRLRGRGVELHACDIHEPSVRWVARTYPDVHAVTNPIDPPLPYPDAHFDLLWAWSVLTHLDPGRQRAWIAEWARVIEPGGLVLATFNGPQQIDRWRARDEASAIATQAGPVLAANGVAFVPADQSGVTATEFTGTTETYGDTFNAPDYMRARYEEAGFEVLATREDAVWGNQNCVIARRLH